MMFQLCPWIFVTMLYEELVSPISPDNYRCTFEEGFNSAEGILIASQPVQDTEVCLS